MIPTLPGASKAELNLSDKNFLIIDDFHEMRSIFRDIVRSIGVNFKNISVASNGSEAIALLKSKQFDVVLCDWNLGPGRNGQQVLEEAKLRNLVEPTCIMIMVTAEKTSEAVTGAAEYQPDAYLIKPITAAILRTRLDRIWLKKEAFIEIHKAMQQKDYSKAISLCDQRLAFDKVNASELLRTKCDLLLKRGELDRAKELLNSILVARELPWAKAGLAKILIKNNELDNAKLLLEETVDENPAFLEGHDLLVKTLQAIGDFEATNRALERAVKLSPNSVNRQKQLGDVAFKLGNLENAEKAFRKSIELGVNSMLKTSDAYFGLAKTCSANTNHEEALKILNKLNENFSDEDVQLKAMAIEGLIHHESGNEEKAQQIATELEKRVAEEKNVQDSERTLDIARLFMATGKKENAIALLQQEIKNNPENNALLEDANKIFEHAGMGEEGAKLMESSRREAIEIMNGGALLIRKGQYEEAIKAMRNARKVMPDNVRVLFNLAHVLITYIQKKGQTPELINEARESLDAANTLSPGESRYSKLMNLLNKLSSAT
jgi:tetratricopeptide (TPR) repeat protein